MMTKDERQLKVLASRDCGQELRQKKCRNSPGWMDERMDGVYVWSSGRGCDGGVENY